MAASLQTIFSNSFLSAKLTVFWLNFPWNMLPFELVYNWSNWQLTDNGLAPYRLHAIIWTNGDLVRGRILVSFGPSELTFFGRINPCYAILSWKHIIYMHAYPIRFEHGDRTVHRGRQLHANLVLLISHGYCWPGDTRNQVINSHDLVYRDIPVEAPGGLNLSSLC